jgi:Cu/Ag efflux pump CusA
VARVTIPAGKDAHGKSGVVSLGLIAKPHRVEVPFGILRDRGRRVIEVRVSVDDHASAKRLLSRRLGTELELPEGYKWEIGVPFYPGGNAGVGW